jgi:hypothetical protein
VGNNLIYFRPNSESLVLKGGIMSQNLKEEDFEIETMPVFDESIFYPGRRHAEYGVDEEDIECLKDFLRWHLDQREKRLKKPLLRVLRERQLQLARIEKNKLLAQMSEIERILNS